MASRKKSTQTPVAEEQQEQVGTTVSEVADQVLATIAEVTKGIDALTQRVSQFGEATADISPAPEVSLAGATVDDIPDTDTKPTTETTAPPATNGEKKHFLSAATHNWLNSRASRKVVNQREGRPVTVADEIRNQVRQGLISGEITKDENGFVPHNLVVEMVRDYEAKEGFGSAGNPLDNEARAYFRSTSFGGGWVNFGLFPELLNLEPGDTVTLEMLKELIQKLDLQEDGEQITCPGLYKTNPCGRQFQPIRGLVFRWSDGKQVFFNGKAVEFGAFVQKGEEIVGHCLLCQNNANKRAFRIAKEKDVKPERIYYRPFDTVQEEINEEKRKVQEAEETERRKDKEVLSLGKIGRLLNNAAARVGKQNARDRNRQNRNLSHKEDRWR